MYEYYEEYSEYVGRKRGQLIIDERFCGRSLEVYTVDGEKLLGLVDEVGCSEIGMFVENTPVIVSRNAILYIVTGLSDVHGAGGKCEKEFVLDENFIGSDVVVKLINGHEIEGRLIKVCKNEIAVAQSNRAIVVPRTSISYIKILRR